jgi:ABC-type branched-subunit amino acid transport system ATPase component
VEGELSAPLDSLALCEAAGNLLAGEGFIMSPEREFAFIRLGRSGMGKTTLIRCLAGLLPVQTGAIRLDREDISLLVAHEWARRDIMTFVQGRGIFPRLTVSENLEMGRIAGGGKKAKPHG